MMLRPLTVAATVLSFASEPPPEAHPLRIKPEMAKHVTAKTFAMLRTLTLLLLINYLYPSRAA
jgi:hypothetical protein